MVSQFDIRHRKFAQSLLRGHNNSTQAVIINFKFHFSFYFVLTLFFTILRLKAGVAYFGPYFSGWVSNHEAKRPSVSKVLSNAFTKLFGDGNVSQIIESSRTDAGVHAIRNCFHIDVYLEGRGFKDRILHPITIRQAINAHLIRDPIFLTDLSIENDLFHCQRNACGRVYMYRIFLTSERYSENIFEDDRSWCLSHNLDLAKMREASNFLLGTHDFSAFRNAGCQSLNPVKTIHKIQIESHMNQLNYDFLMHQKVSHYFSHSSSP